ncbi:MAG: malto-oligosyltrehalose synthase [Actinomycetota bacterium]|nr:malto-oligosyltrehalose synthase [Actinomycetota bacterium]
MRVPRATYRLQFNKDFTFSDAVDLVPYLAELGVSDLYASPYMKARPGSTHGYDVIDHNSLNPEIGPTEDYERLVETLHEHGMSQLLDIVPNHMGVGSDNPWWTSVLEHGPASPRATFFDIDWYPTNRPRLHGKVLLPVLGDHYRAVLEGGEISLSFNPEVGSLSATYYEHECPLDPKTYPMVLSSLEDLPEDECSLELESLVTAFGNLPGRDATDEEALEERARDADINKNRLARLCAESREIAHAIEERVRRLNGVVGEPESFESLHRILEEQAYRLVFWRVASDEINYRRFFAINDLAGVRVEDEGVFEATHRFFLDLVGSGKISGLRIDHPDGLHDPAEYFQRLQKAAAGALGSDEKEPLYILAEKILAHHESLPEDWPIAGTTGYDFTNLVNGLFVDPDGEAGMDRSYRRFLGRETDFEELLYNCKKLIMRDALASELNVLSRRLIGISTGIVGDGYAHRSHDFTINTLRDALTEVVAEFPVYRTYAADGQISELDTRYIEWAIGRARKRSTAADTTVFDFIQNVLLLREDGSEEHREDVLAFVMKFQQYTGPVMAKGMEDTALYIHNRLASLNEVGGEPERFGVSVAAFHLQNTERARNWPHAMLASSTHDTKRGEDVRARINVLSEIPNDWRAALTRWSRLNRSRRREVDSLPAPARNDEYLFYQTLLGAWPLENLDENSLADFTNRIKAYMEKAMREAQVHTSWTNTNDEYEAAVSDFIETILAPGNDLFLEDFASFERRTARLGALNALSQTLLKLTVPGVPDVYQGNELWDLSLVDPDNRRPVDYGLRQKLLAGLKAMNRHDAQTLLAEDTWRDGRSKLYLTWKALELRRENPDLFERGEYVPLEVVGEKSDHILAFARRLEDNATITITPRLQATLIPEDGLLVPPSHVWADTGIEIPEGLASLQFHNVLIGESVRATSQNLSVAETLRDFPVALLVAR